MKINKLMPIAFAGIILLTACAKKTDTTTSVSFSTTPAMTATISGVAWSGDNVSATSASIGTTNVLNISGYSYATGNSVALAVPDNVTPGTYTVNGSTYTLTYNKNSSTYYIASSGTITITNYANSYINGNFQGTVVNTKNASDKVTITNGTFTAKVQ